MGWHSFEKFLSVCAMAAIASVTMLFVYGILNILYQSIFQQ